MAKVKEEVVEAALLKLVDKINSTMPNSTYKFLVGGAAGLLSLGNVGKLKAALQSFKDSNGLVDTCDLRKIYTSAFRASNGKLHLELFNKPDSLLSLFVKPITLTISLEDIEDLMKEIEQNSATTEVALASSTTA